ncbi:MAG: protein-(glutamine-N5) methyltransferase, release factor-specific [Candidatus Omnitrophica bacterium CG11_big_fil_rev_8_21_14_0_20_64_10]|nr:MAG: protein-(glutamine-N5) methyltransferase, release factor-specific [Candidatus Omnitrophica bacterium CG11_big_fil_rev_8_21_14_0_20_64_10]
MSSLLETRAAERRRVAELLERGTARLAAAGVERPDWTARTLLADRTGQTAADLAADPAPIASEAEYRFLRDIAGRAAGVPLQYLLGRAPFYGRDFEVGPGVFIPRPETERLVEEGLKWIAASPARLEVLEIGTGSGAVAVTLALAAPEIRVTATERSAVALAFARRNAAAFGASIRFLPGEGTADLPAGSMDGVICNPPYVDWEAGGLPRELAWEPRLSLDGGLGGIAVIRGWLQAAHRVARPGGLWLSEIGEDQAQRLRLIARETGWIWEGVEPDLTGRDRVLRLRRNHG